MVVGGWSNKPFSDFFKLLHLPSDVELLLSRTLIKTLLGEVMNIKGLE